MTLINKKKILAPQSRNAANPPIGWKTGALRIDLATRTTQEVGQLSVRSAHSLATSETTVDAYPSIRAMTQAHLAMPGSQPGDPRKAAVAITAIAERGTGPLRQQLGTDSSDLAANKVAALTTDIEAGRALAQSTDYASRSISKSAPTAHADVKA